MKKIKNMILTMILLLAIVPPVSVSADMGPKPSVVIEFVGLEEEEYYVTLLSEKDSTGPWSHGNEYYDYMGDEAVFQKFCEYEDEDGYYFLSFMEDCSEDDSFEWTYYPPSPFKILIYFPAYDKFLPADGIYERYAFDSYFTVKVSELETIAVSGGEEAEESDAVDDKEEAQVETEQSSDKENVVTDEVTEGIVDEVPDVQITAEQSYDFAPEILSFGVRVVATIVIEIAIAFLFLYRDKKALTVIAVTNVFTQVVLNVLLNVINYRSGQYAFVFHYVWMECVVFAIEAFVYTKFIGRENTVAGHKYHPCLYAAVANIVSLVVGIWIARVIPGIF